MRDYFWQRMESDRGDLADVVRSGGWVAGTSTASTDQIPAISDWHLPSDPSTFFPSDSIESINSFGDSFASFYDPLLDELTTGIEFFNNSSSSSSSNGADGHGGGIVVVPQKLPMGADEETKKPLTRTIMPRLFQVASAGSGGIKACPLSPPEMILVGEMMTGSSGVRSADEGSLQISSPRALGIKRRKNQVKRVVCIPAPAAAGSRPSGEVVPSDLWAWRKYGQKPIKGSPYPRGYYRCSSSKGCSARKQVERSRTNPNMLVVTYTSEHNHPWPTQRNALAGSTRSQSGKKINTAAGSSAPIRIKSDDHPLKGARGDSSGRKDEETSSGSIDNSSSWVKEETTITAPAGGDDGLGADVDACKCTGGAVIHDDDDDDRQIMMSCGKLQEADDDDSCLFTELAELELDSDPTSALFFSKVQHLLRSRPAGDQKYASDTPNVFNYLIE